MAAPQAPLMTSAGQDTRPVPDPTFLTTQLLQREMACLREIIETRLDGMDKAIELLQVTTDRFPALVDTKIGNLQDLHAERFRTMQERFVSIQQQFVERDVRTEQTIRDGKVSVDAALTAAKEAVGAANTSSALAVAKSEFSVTKQLDQLVILIQTNMNGIDSKINDLKDRVGQIEGKGIGQVASKVTQDNSSSFLVAVAAVVLSFLGLIAMVIFSLVRK